MVGALDASRAWTRTLEQVPNDVTAPSGTVTDPCPPGSVTRRRDPATWASQALGWLKVKRATLPGRSITTDPAGPLGTDGAVAGCPWAPSSRTWGIPFTVHVLAETLRSPMVV